MTEKQLANTLTQLKALYIDALKIEQTITCDLITHEQRYMNKIWQKKQHVIAKNTKRDMNKASARREQIWALVDKIADTARELDKKWYNVN